MLKSTETGELTSTVGQEYFWNRIIAVLFFNGISLFVAIAFFASLLGLRSSAQSSQVAQRAAPAVSAGKPETGLPNFMKQSAAGPNV
ncbi:MAG: hypothetical protein HKN05_14630 [Rhizobiales bacterium]|nr:hypothetical protein [Hyphomicrobiales bacterium]